MESLGVCLMYGEVDNPEVPKLPWFMASLVAVIFSESYGQKKHRTVTLINSVLKTLVAI